MTDEALKAARIFDPVGYGFWLCVGYERLRESVRGQAAGYSLESGRQGGTYDRAEPEPAAGSG